MARPAGIPVGNIATALIKSAWENYNPGKVSALQQKQSRTTLVRPFPTFYNSMMGQSIGVEPDSDTEAARMDFKEIRKFADEHELTRTVIETCKEQITKLRWAFRLIPQQGESAEEAKNKSDKDPRIKELTDFFQFPDKEHDFSQWLRLILEEFLVCDTAVIWQHQTILDKTYALRILDTSTIRPCINEMGVTPDPDLPYPANVAYEQYINGRLNQQFTTDEMIYYVRNPRVWAFYGYSPVEQVILTLATGMRRMAMQLYHYTDGNVPSMFMRMPKEWTLPQIQEFQLYWNELLAGNLGELAKGWAIPGDVDPVFPQKDNLKDDFDEWVARVICYAFSVSPNAFIKNLNRATSEQAREQADEEGLQSRVMLVKRLIDHIQKKWFGYTDIEFNLLYDRPQDSKKQAEIDKIYVVLGIKSVDEVRRDLGLPPIGAPNRMLTTNGYLPLTKGDEPQFDIFQQKLESSTDEDTVPDEKAKKTKE